MITARADPVRVRTPDTDEEVERHDYAWYDPDAAAFDLGEAEAALDARAEFEPLADEDVTAFVDWGLTPR